MKIFFPTRIWHLFSQKVNRFFVQPEAPPVGKCPIHWNRSSAVTKESPLSLSLSLSLNHAATQSHAHTHSDALVPKYSLFRIESGRQIFFQINQSCPWSCLFESFLLQIYKRSHLAQRVGHCGGLVVSRVSAGLWGLGFIPSPSKLCSREHADLKLVWYRHSAKEWRIKIPLAMLL